MASRAGEPGTGEDAARPGAARAEGAGALFEAVFETSAAGLAVVVGEELRIARVNPAFRALVPHPDVDPTGRTLQEVWGTAIPDGGKAFRRTLDEGTPLNVEDHAVPMGGRVRRLSTHVRRVAWQGAPALLVEVWETTPLWEAREVAEDAAQVAMRHAVELDAVLDAVADGFVLCGPGGEILRMNREARRFAPGGRPANVAEWTSRLGTCTPEGRPVPYAQGPVARALTGETLRAVHLRVRLAGRPAWLIASTAPVRSPDGAITGAVLTFSDETALHQLEEERDDLVRMISHDLRTPLNAVYTQAHLLGRHPGEPARVVERAQAIAESCERMSTMIQDLVEATLLESGQLRVERAPLDLRALLAGLLARLSGGIEVDRVRTSLPPDLPRVDGDAHRLERVFVNLLSNALKYSPPQSEVLLEARASADEVVVAVTDRGVGIAPEDLAHVFERYYRARGARRPEGLGLGLYIARLLVEAHGGRLEAASMLGQGSTFRVVLPALAPAGAGASV